VPHSNVAQFATLEWGFFCGVGLRHLEGAARLRYMHRNPVKCGVVLEPEHWEWSSYRSYAFQEEGRVKINQWPKAVMKVRPVA
jgi:hypothetical protein